MIINPFTLNERTPKTNFRGNLSNVPPKTSAASVRGARADQRALDVSPYIA